ncbi:hypothetical protein SARC_04842 [Sphaeroforma arctica JP610]|uniref:2Fe-2S ferredoxin-type domain-containing protein n=1 Tax=Sphaeroforma arctica JP610 TaxID=667725 RepID=A0A0L0G160_9EUKA|nr:hypothetical protein SARC_04842 [Sphaeroforma arctica JP610]KNC82877.1 hypothetical protein SARC_04842 [Sphaeroforma arctica JP610]|eukprot:XP_014156779.1 hypothetical protein SARC_04842 [Sphaeroforma arctica JP610]
MLRSLVNASKGRMGRSGSRLLHATRQLGDKPKTVEVTINGEKITVPAAATVLQACEAAGIEVPRFCYHERLPKLSFSDCEVLGG